MSSALSPQTIFDVSAPGRRSSTIPEAGANTGAGEVPMSQSTAGVQCGSVIATPSHCSTYTC